MAEKEHEEKLSSLDVVLEKLKKRFGAGSILPASQARALQIPRIETGVFSVDYATGGGMPVGRIIVVWGDKSSGKSALMMKTVASSQRYCRRCLVVTEPTGQLLNRCPFCGSLQPKKETHCPNPVCKDQNEGKGIELVIGVAFERKCQLCKKNEAGGVLGYDPLKVVWMDAEGVYDLPWSSKLGVNNDHVYMIRTENAEDAIDIADAVLRSGGCDVLVVDSVAHLTPQKEIEESMEDWQVGLAARLMNKALRKWVSSLNEPGLKTANRPTVFLINQERMKVGVMFGPNTVKPGGRGQDFADSLELRMWPGKMEKDSIGNPICALTNFVTEKNKTAPSHLQGGYKFWIRDWKDAETGMMHRAGDTGEDLVVLDYALKFEVVKYDGKKYTFDGLAETSKDAIREAITKDRTKFKKLRGILLKMPLGTISHDLNELEKKQKRAAAEKAAEA